MKTGFPHLEKMARIENEEGEAAAESYALLHREEIRGELDDFSAEAKRLCEVFVQYLRPVMESIVETWEKVSVILEEAGHQLPDDDSGPAEEAGVV